MYYGVVCASAVLQNVTATSLAGMGDPTVMFEDLWMRHSRMSLIDVDAHLADDASIYVMQTSSLCAIFFRCISFIK